MTTTDEITRLALKLPAERQTQILEFAQFLSELEERAAWHAAGRQFLARAYGDDEPDYSEAECKKS